MSTFHVAGLQTYTLSGSIGSTDTSFTLSSFLEPVTGTALTMANLATDINYGTIAPKTTSSEFISFTTITQNANGTCTLGGVVRGLAKKYPYTTDAAYKLPHSGQSQFILSDAPQVLNQYASKTHDETISGQWTFSLTPISPAGGVSDASTTVKGVSTLSVAPVSATAPIAVGDNDPRLLTLTIGNFIFPIGSIYTNASVATNPATLLGFGTWTAFGTGQVLVGVDTGQTEFDVLGETGGEKTHVLTTAEMPSHTHLVAGTIGGGGSSAVVAQVNGAGMASGSAGSGTAHNNLQPYITVYYWKRTA